MTRAAAAATITAERPSPPQPARYLFARLHLPLLHDGAVGSRRAAAQSGGGHVRDGGGQHAQVSRAGERDVLGEGAVQCEARLLLRLAHGGPRAVALAAVAAREDEGHGHAVAHREPRRAFAQRRHHAR